MLLRGKFPMKEKKLLVVRLPDSRKTSWFAPFQGILTNTDLLLSSEKSNSYNLFRNAFH